MPIRLFFIFIVNKTLRFPIHKMAGYVSIFVNMKAAKAHVHNHTHTIIIVQHDPKFRSLKSLY